MNRYVALLRGINVGGKGIIGMAELKACFEAAGLQDVATYINSGNILFSSAQKDQRKLEELIEANIVKKFGFIPKTVVRSREQMQAIVANLPKSWATNPDQKFNVIFLSHTIDSPSVLDGLNPKAGIETLVYQPGVLYWSANTSDLTKSSMLQLYKNKIYQEATVRNLNTTKKLTELLG